MDQLQLSWYTSLLCHNIDQISGWKILGNCLTAKLWPRLKGQCTNFWFQDFLNLIRTQVTTLEIHFKKHLIYKHYRKAPFLTILWQRFFLGTGINPVHLGPFRFCSSMKFHAGNRK